MKAQCLPLDIISNLPSSIIQRILTFLPIHDAFRTSILSRKWRYHCANIPKLEFNERIWRGPALPNKHKLMLDIYTILLLHQCPVLEFSLSIAQLQSCCEIDQIILYLSRNTALEKFTLCIGMSYHSHKLPTSFLSLQNLTHLKLQKCLIPPLGTLSRFGRLTSLCLYEVVITKSTLLQFLSCCPLIRNFTLIEEGSRFTQSGCSDFVDLFWCLPLIERLEMNRCPVKLFALGVIPPKLTNAIVHLKYLGLFGLSFAKEDELSSVFLLVSSSPNIKKFKLEEYLLFYRCAAISREVVSQTAKGFFDVLDYSDISLEHLCEIEITNFSGMKPEMDFVKVILAKSPILENVQLMFDKMIDVHKRCWTLEELLKLPRPSSRAKIIVKQ